jgi:pilus assembly protein Flp/PilA
MFLRAYTWLQSGLVALRTKAREERGAAAVEYGLLVALIAAIIVVVVSVLGKKVSNAFSSVAGVIP